MLALLGGHLILHVSGIRVNISNTICKGINYISNFGQNTGLKKKLDTACKQNAS